MTSIATRLEKLERRLAERVGATADHHAEIVANLERVKAIKRDHPEWIDAWRQQAVAETLALHRATASPSTTTESPTGDESCGV